ncbi:hypothetical protein LGAA44_90042 [Leuconostoc gasicomitatum]|nr:hypothetical protein LGAA44_90042 [Leuconostoc gasicomitatum]
MSLSQQKLVYHKFSAYATSFDILPIPHLLITSFLLIILSKK